MRGQNEIIFNILKLCAAFCVSPVHFLLAEAEKLSHKVKTLIDLYIGLLLKIVPHSDQYSSNFQIWDISYPDPLSGLHPWSHWRTSSFMPPDGFFTVYFQQIATLDHKVLLTQ
jgi:hypothetical protein